MSLFKKDISKKELEKAVAVENKNKATINKLIADAEGYLAKHYNNDYYNIVAKSCETEMKDEESRYAKVKMMNNYHKESKIDEKTYTKFKARLDIFAKRMEGYSHRLNVKY